MSSLIFGKPVEAWDQAATGADYRAFMFSGTAFIKKLLGWAGGELMRKWWGV